MVKIEVIRNSDPEVFKSDLQQFFVDKGLASNEFLSIQIIESDIAITAVIVYFAA